MAKKKVPKRTLLRRLKTKADKALSQYIRAKTFREFGICPLCNKNPIQVSFHFVTRKRAITRWDDQNVVGACKTCNYLENYFSDVSRAWYIRRHGTDQYLQLVDKAQQNFIPTEEYLLDIINIFTEKLANLGTSQPT